MMKHVKLNYDEISICPRAVSRSWDKFLASNNSNNSMTCISQPSPVVGGDSSLLAQLVADGVPKQRRGEIWRLLVDTGNLTARSSTDDDDRPKDEVQVRSIAGID